MKQTRRAVLGAAGAGIAGLAGCSGFEAPAGSGSASSEYSVTMEPVGEVGFNGVPERIATYFPGYADMFVALGHGDALTAIGNASRYHTDHYEELGLDAPSDLTQLIGESGIDKETIYALDSDLHQIDPNWLTKNSFFGLEESDIEELESQQAPFLGNVIFRRTDSWHDYRYYTMYEAFEKLSQVVQEQATYEALAEFHNSFIADIQAKLPPADDRPAALLVFAGSDEPESFSPYRVADRGTNKKQFHDLGVEDALAGTGINGLSTTERGQIDHETMLNVDPEVLLVRGHETKTDAEFEETVVSFMESHNVASDLSAVQNGEVYRGGPIYAGPLHNLFLTERFATNLYPDTFSGELFDRDEVATIVGGEN
ncbi:MAG: iron complex transport system substrate-binding protein [Natronomonas sp.]|jgi:iron complex transport system substrate-binding protein